MKISKVLSISLALGTILNYSLSALANTSTEDVRYEAFQNSNITVNDVLEHKKTDVEEIEGDTLINVLDYNNYDDFYWFDGTLDNEGYIEITAETSNYKNFFLKKNTVNVKPNTTYTFFIDIIENTLVRSDGSKGYCFTFGATNTYLDASYWKDSKWLDGGMVGKYSFTLDTKEDFSDVKTADRGFVNSDTMGKIKFKYMIVEGDHTDKDVDCFKGVKSVGEQENGNHSIEIKSQNSNLFNTDNLQAENYNGINNDASINVLEDSIKISKLTSSSNFVGTRIKCKKGVKYTVGFIGGTCKSGMPYSIYVYNNKPYGHEILRISNSSNSEVSYKTFTTTNTEFYVGLYLENSTEIGEVLEYKNVFVGEGDTYDYVRHEENSITLNLREPLRGLPNGIKDRIIKKDGRWLVERNVDAKVYDNAKYFRNQMYTEYLRGERDDIIIYESDTNKTLKQSNRESENKSLVVLKKSKQTRYEPLHTAPTIYLCEGTTHLTTDSNIPANLTITVDRIANIAKKYSEIAKLNPTIENISRARMWINLMDESILKDQIQENINNIFKINGIALNKEFITSNMDLYVKFENTLIMTLNTNNIIFEDFNGAEDMIKENAVQISVDSSLPYSLNAYLVSEIQNADKSNTISKNILNIKENRENNYQAFSNTRDKIVLKDNNPEGNNSIHNIDIKLNGGITHKKDVYKTTIKFEAEQK